MSSFSLEVEEASPELISSPPFSEHRERQVAGNSLGKQMNKYRLCQWEHMKYETLTKLFKQIRSDAVHWYVQSSLNN